MIRTALNRLADLRAAMPRSDTDRREARILIAVIVVVGAALVPVVLLRSTGTSEASGFASLEVIDDGAELRGPGGKFEAADSGDSVSVGSKLRTDATGFVELDYFDDSSTRLGPDTTLAVVDLEDRKSRPRIVVRLDVGKALNRIGALGTDGVFEMHTGSAVATGRGAEFSVECETVSQCRIIVVSGVVDITPDQAPALSLTNNDSVTLDGGVIIDQRRLTDEELANYPWILFNRSYDASLNAAPASQPAPSVLAGVVAPAAPSGALGSPGPVGVPRGAKPKRLPASALSGGLPSFGPPSPSFGSPTEAPPGGATPPTLPPAGSPTTTTQPATTTTKPATTTTRRPPTTTTTTTTTTPATTTTTTPATTTTTTTI